MDYVVGIYIWNVIYNSVSYDDIQKYISLEFNQWQYIKGEYVYKYYSLKRCTRDNLVSPEILKDYVIE